MGLAEYAAKHLRPAHVPIHYPQRAMAYRCGCAGGGVVSGVPLLDSIPREPVSLDLLAKSRPEAMPRYKLRTLLILLARNTVDRD